MNFFFNELFKPVRINYQFIFFQVFEHFHEKKVVHVIHLKLNLTANAAPFAPLPPSYLNHSSRISHQRSEQQKKNVSCFSISNKFMLVLCTTNILVCSFHAGVSRYIPLIAKYPFEKSTNKIFYRARWIAEIHRKCVRSFLKITGKDYSIQRKK